MIDLAANDSLSDYKCEARLLLYNEFNNQKEKGVSIILKHPHMFVKGKFGVSGLITWVNKFEEENREKATILWIN